MRTSTDGGKDLTHGDSPLVARKITVPISRGPVVARPRLVDALKAGHRYPLVTLVAPAGWGKTTLLSSWLHAPGPQTFVAWLSVDGEDNDAVCFWSNVIASLTSARELAEDHPLADLRPTQDTCKDSRFVAQVIDAIAGLDYAVCLVLDDVHEIVEPSIAAGLAYLVTHVPPNFRIVLSGRFLPNVPLGRMRVAHEVLEIDARALAFTEVELAHVVQAAERGISPDQVRSLLQRTEGWPAGARLAELSIAGQTDLTRAIDELTGEESMIAEYFANEVFDRQESDVKEFLLLTCVVDSLTPALANALCGRSDSEQILERMARNNAFIAIQGKKPWYRYHQLLAETLRSRFRRERPELMREQHRIAARWHAVRTDTAQAIAHAVKGEDLQTAKSVLEPVWLDLVLDGELTTLAHLLGLFPSGAIDADGLLLLIRAVLELETGNDRTARADADAGDRQLREASDGQRARCLAGMVRLRLAQHAGDIVGAREAAAAVLSTSTCAADDALRAFALLSLGVCEYFTGQRHTSRDLLREGLALARATEHDYLAAGFLSQLAVVHSAEDRPVDAVEVAQEAVDLAERRGWAATPQIAVTWHALGWAHYLWNRLDDADGFLDRAELAAADGDATLLAAIHMVQGLVQLVRGNHRAAMALIEAAEQGLGAALDRFVFTSYIQAAKVRLQIAMGDLEEAERLLEHYRGERSPRVAVILAEAELARALGDSRAVLEAVRPALERERGAFLDQRLQALALAALASDDIGLDENAQRLLERALDLAAPGRYMQPFLQFGEPMKGLLARHRVCSGHGPFALELLGAKSWDCAGELRDSGAELLSDRETEVLSYVAEMLTAAEIGAELFLSVNTVKSHLKNIYRKLGVSSRRRAVARGVELGLIEPNPPRA